MVHVMTEIMSWRSIKNEECLLALHYYVTLQISMIMIYVISSSDSLRSIICLTIVIHAGTVTEIDMLFHS